jgi:hypothetical protein
VTWVLRTLTSLLSLHLESSYIYIYIYILMLGFLLVLRNREKYVSFIFLSETVPLN